MRNTSEWAADYLERGWQPLPVLARRKNPGFKDWQNYRVGGDALGEVFGSDGNVGVLLGEPSGWLVDIDLDCPEARWLAPYFLPETGAVSGRTSTRRSHFWYVAPLAKTAKFQDPTAAGDRDRGMLVELRSTGGQTLVPPSTHTSGEEIRWEEDGEPAEVDADELHRAVGRLASCALVACHWPAPGSRHETALALAGMLLRAGWSVEDATLFVCRAAEAAKDEEWRDRAADVRSTLENLAAGKPVTGVPTLNKQLGPESALIVERLAEWLALPRGGSASYANEVWQPRRALPSLEAEVPLLREELLPAPLRPWLADAAERLQVPLEYVAVPAVVAAASLIGRTAGIHPKRQDDWFVVPNLWGAIVGRPGFLKSPSLSEGTRPLRRLAAEAAEQFKEKETAREAHHAAVKAQLEAVKNQMRARAKKNEDGALSVLEQDYADLARDLAEIATSAKRYITNDSTVEKLAMLLGDNPRGLLLMRDELVGWMRVLEKQGREADRAFYLESWNGYGSYEIDRVERGSLRVPALCLSVLGGIQPGKLIPYVLDASEGGEGDDGLLQRMQLIVWPEPPSDWKEVDRWPDSDARMRTNRVYEELDRLTPDKLGAEDDPDGRGEIPAVRFTDEAQELFSRWYGDLERRLRSGTIESPALESHLAKFRSLIPSLALIFHAIDVVAGSAAAAGVPAESTWLAIEWAEYLEAHAEKVYAAHWNRDLHAAHALAHKLERGAITDRQTVRSIYRPQWSRLHSRELVEAGLEVLEEHGWVRLVNVATEGRSRDVVRIHPDLIDHGAE